MSKILLLIFLVSVHAHAQYEEYESYETFTELDKFQRDYGLILSPSFMYSSIEENNQVSGATPTDRTRSLLFYDLRLGYIFRGGFYFGILYSGETENINDSAPETTRESVGLSFGYTRKGWSVTGTFIPYSKQSLQNTLDYSAYTEGMGYQIDGAYYFRLGRFFSIGPQLVFKSLKYGKGENVSTSVNQDATSQHDVLTPMLSMVINLYRG